MKHTQIRQLAALALTAVILFPSCSKKSFSGSYASSADSAIESKAMYEEEAYMDMDDMEGASFSGSGYDKNFTAEAPAEPEPVPSPKQENQKETFERKLIRTGYIRLEVEGLGDFKGKVENWVKNYGGYIASSDEGSSYVNYTVKIPSNRFDEAMGETASFGKLKNKNINSQDVTDRYYDLKSRLETKRVMQERLENYLKSAKDVKDMLEIESKMNEVTSDLEAMQGQMNRLSSQIDFSEITISANLRPNHTESGFQMPDVGHKFGNLLYNVVDFFISLFFTLLYVVIFGIPIILVLALLYWLCFGKIGLIRKLFAKLKK